MNKMLPSDGGPLSAVHWIDLITDDQAITTATKKNKLEKKKTHPDISPCD